MPKYHLTHAGRYSAHPSSAVFPVASCHRAMPSFSTYLKNAPTAIAQSRMTPYRAPPTVAATTSPDPMPVAATTRPGPASLRKLSDAGRRDAAETGSADTDIHAPVRLVGP